MKKWLHAVETLEAESRYLLADLKVLRGVSPLAGQNETPWAGERIPQQEVSVTLHQALCDLQVVSGYTNTQRLFAGQTFH